MAITASTLTWLLKQSIILSLVLYSGYFVAKSIKPVYKFARRFWSPIRQFDGPPPSSLLLGNSPELVADDTNLHYWQEKYGRVYRTTSILGTNRLCTLDPRAINHILTRTDIYPKSVHADRFLAAFIGEGLVVTRGDVHRRQRRIMNPCFAPMQVREMVPMFYDIAYQLRDILSDLLAKAPEEQVEMDMFWWCGRATLDAIGITGFGYRFNSLVDDTNEFLVAMHGMEDEICNLTFAKMLKDHIPLLKYMPGTQNPVLDGALATTHRIGSQLVMQKKKEIEQEMLSGKVNKDSVVGRDALSTLIRANMAADLAPHQRMSDSEVLAQISTIIMAGHETTASGTAWAMLSLGQHPEVQDKLRQELLSVPDDAPSMDDLNALPYLDKVVKEALRLHCPIHFVIRTAAQDDVIPLSQPVKDKNGKVHDSIEIYEGDWVGVDVVAINRSTELWGPDADEFRPERWDEDLERASDIPGIWAHQLTFIAGPRACIGWRMSIIEMKVLMFTLLRKFEFLPCPDKQIDVRCIVVARPQVHGEEHKGVQLPMIMRPIPKTSA